MFLKYDVLQSHVKNYQDIINQKYNRQACKVLKSSGIRHDIENDLLSDSAPQVVQCIRYESTT